MAMEEAVHDETPWIQKCKHIQEELEGLSKARRTALTSSEPTQHHYKTHFKVCNAHHGHTLYDSKFL